MSAESFSSTKPPNRNRNLMIGGGILVVLLCCCCVAVVVMIVVDPLGWGIKDRLFGGGGKAEAAASAMPVDSGVYMSVNLKEFPTDKVNSLIAEYGEQMDLPSGVNSVEDLMDELDQQLDSALDMTIEKDIKPWVGDAIGFALIGLEIGSSQPSSNMVDFVVAIEVKDQKAADEFFKKLAGKVEDLGGGSISESDYKGVKIYEFKPDSEYGQSMAFARSGGVALISMQADNIEQAIDAQKGESLAKDSKFRDTINQLPADRIITVYMTGEQYKSLLNLSSQINDVFGEITEELGGEYMPQPEISTIAVTGMNAMAVSASVLDNGVQIDSVVAYDKDEMPDWQKKSLEMWDDKAKAPDMFPQDTFLYIGSPVSGEAVLEGMDMALEAMGSSGPDFEESLQSVEDQTGVNLREDFIAYLNGEMAVALYPSSEGALAQSAKVDVGFAALLETNDAKAMAETLEKFNSAAEDEGAPIEAVDIDGMSFFEVSDGSQVMLTYGMGKEYLVMATSTDDIKVLFDQKAPLSKNELYRDAQKALPSGMTPMFFADVQSIFGLVRETMSGSALREFNDQTAFLKSVRLVVMGASIKGDIGRTTIVILTEP